MSFSVANIKSIFETIETLFLAKHYKNRCIELEKELKAERKKASRYRSKQLK